MVPSQLEATSMWVTPSLKNAEKATKSMRYLVLIAEPTIHVLVHQRRLADTGITEDNHLEKRLLSA